MNRIIFRLVALILVLIMGATQCFASTSAAAQPYRINSVSELKSTLASLPNNADLTEDQKRELIAETNPAVAQEFLAGKLEKLFQKMDETEIAGTGQKNIDLGDHCTATIVLSDEPEDSFGIASSTPGATTLWKDFGDRMFTARFEIRSVVLDVDLILVNHYTISDRGIALRYGESDVNKLSGLDIGSAAAGPVVEAKTTAYTIGSSIEVRSTFTYTWAPVYDIDIVTKKFKMSNVVKFSDIDLIERQVKVVQSWYGVYL